MKEFSISKAHEMWRAHFVHKLQHYQIIGIKAAGLNSTDIQRILDIQKDLGGVLSEIIEIPQNEASNGQKSLKRKRGDEAEIQNAHSTFAEDVADENPGSQPLKVACAEEVLRRLLSYELLYDSELEPCAQLLSRYVTPTTIPPLQLVKTLNEDNALDRIRPLTHPLFEQWMVLNNITLSEDTA